MTIEDNLFDMLKHINLGGGGFGSLSELVRMCGVNVLKQLRIILDAKIAELSSGAYQSRSSSGTGGFSNEFGDLNPFNILGVSVDATEEEVRKAYKEKARKAHPDTGGSDLEMAKVNAAMETICRFKGWKR